MKNNQKLKIVLIGDVDSRKKEIIPTLYGETVFTYRQPLGVDFCNYQLSVDNAEDAYTLQIWDTTGQERFRSISSSYYRGTHGVLLVINLDNPDSLKSINKWHNDARQHCCENTVIMVAAITSNKPGEATITALNQIIDELGITCQVSNLDTIALNNLFVDLCHEIKLQTQQPVEDQHHQPIAATSNNDTYLSRLKNWWNRSKDNQDSVSNNNAALPMALTFFQATRKDDEGNEFKVNVATTIATEQGPIPNPEYDSSIHQLVK